MKTKYAIAVLCFLAQLPLAVFAVVGQALPPISAGASPGSYCETAPSPPRRQLRQMPKPLPFATINVQRVESRVNSPALSVAPAKGVSVTLAPVERLWSFVPHAASPGESPAWVTTEAEFVQVPPTGTVATSLTTMEVGTAGVNVLLIKSFLTERDTRPFGVTGQEQQAIICSSGENT
jgi:hypothetical protein